MTPLLAWSHDSILGCRSGYHVLADYLPQLERVVEPRRDPDDRLQRILTKVLRRFSFSRWCAGGSFQMERKVLLRVKAGFKGPVHLLWCDRDLGFLDFKLNGEKNPLIGTFHQCPRDLLTAIRRRSSLKKFAAVIVMSETQRPYFRESGVPDGRIHRILHGVDTDYFRPETHEVPENFVVLAVGGTRRDFPLLREVAVAMRDTPAIRFEIAGPADKKALFTGLPNVLFHDHLSDKVLLEKFRNASCLLHLAEEATANNVLLEAMACGLPVITQRVGGIPEYVNETCAVTCPPADSGAVVAALRSLCASPSRQSEMRHAARSHALSLDWRIMAGHSMQLYQSLN